MRTIYQEGSVFDPITGSFIPMDIQVENGMITKRAPHLDSRPGDRVFHLQGLTVFPGFVDVHVHLREPGFSYKETIATGSLACAHGGYTTVCAMPNLNPVPDTIDHLSVEERLIHEEAVIRVLPYASITLGQLGEGTLVDMKALVNRVVGFSDDGRGVKTEELMFQAMKQCAALNGLISAHCEDLSMIPNGGAIHDGSYARKHHIPGIPSESEWKPIARDIELCRETGCRYHVCHVSSKESVELIRKAKADGVNITCETAPHYLLLCQDDLPTDPNAPDAGRYKMNPPLRTAEDRAALIAGLLDGTIDCIATDHAPHSAEEKSRGLVGSSMGIVGIETAFPLLYTHLVETGILSLGILIDKLCYTPRRRFNLSGGIELGDPAELTVFDLHDSTFVQPESFFSKGHSTPFAGWLVHASCCLTVCGDKIAWNNLREANA